MSYNVYLADTFQKCVKLLKKKYRRIKDDIVNVIEKLEEDPSIGDPIPGWNKEVWKIRAASSDIKRGKRGGFRLIYLWKAGEPKLYLLAIYAKGIQSFPASKLPRLIAFIFIFSPTSMYLPVQKRAFHSSPGLSEGFFSEFSLEYLIFKM